MSHAVAARARQLPPGTRLGRYTLIRRIARGGMAELYLASAEGAEGFRKLFALKLVAPHLTEDPRLVAMFLDEARLAARLDHPNIAQVVDLGEADGEHYMAMEYVHGRDLREVLADAAPEGLSLACALSVVMAACDGLDYAHERADEHGNTLGIVHRDVSPSNLLVRYDGCVKLVDFGIAKAAMSLTETRTGMLKGKSGYMSPEQARGAKVDRRSDVFGLGILLYEATTCERLFWGDNEFAVLNRMIDVDIDPPSARRPGYPPELEAIVMRALAKDPAERFATARQLGAALDDVCRGAGLKPSAQALGAYMRGRFGDPPLPSASELPHPVSAITAVDEPPSRPVRLDRLMWIGGAALLIAAGFMVGRTTTDDIEPVADPSRASTPRDSAATAVVEPADGTVQSPSAIAVPVPIVAGTAAEPAPEPDPEPDPEPGVLRPEQDPEPTPRRSGKSRRDPKKRDKPPPGRSLDSMMPRG